jgi:hypothetical protein
MTLSGDGNTLVFESSLHDSLVPSEDDGSFNAGVYLVDLTTDALSRIDVDPTNAPTVGGESFIGFVTTKTNTRPVMTSDGQQLIFGSSRDLPVDGVTTSCTYTN